MATVESDHAVRESAGVDHRWGIHEGDSIGRLRYAGRLANGVGYPQGGMAQLRTDEMVSFVDEM